jgi:hypothetical protein
VCSASADPSPIARVQHLIYMAAFFNKEADAAQLVKNITGEYKASVTTATPTAPVMLWVGNGSLFEIQDKAGTKNLTGWGYTVSYAPYKTQFTKDAGAQFVPVAEAQMLETSGAKSVSEAAGPAVIFAPELYPNEAAMYMQLHKLLQKVDILIDETSPSASSEVQFVLDLRCLPRSYASGAHGAFLCASEWQRV